MAEKSFGIKEINLIGASGTPTIESPNNLNLNAVNVAISTNVSIGGTLTVTGNVSVGGTLTYEDVTNIDSVGLITARSGIKVSAGGSITIGTGVTFESNGQAAFVGVITASKFVGDGSSLTGVSGGGFSPDAQGNLLAGTNAGDSFSGTDANHNVLLGLDAGTAITTADGCIFIGQNAGEVNTTRGSLVAIGNNSGTKVNNAYGFTAVGGSAGQNHQTGQYCVYIGFNAGKQLTGSATDNTIIGGEAHYNATSGGWNVSIGKQAMSLAADANNCTAVGTKALQTSSQGGSGGDNNTALGYEAGDQLVTGSNCTILGFSAQASSTSVSNEITLGNANITSLRVPGIGVTFSSTTGDSFANDGKFITGTWTVTNSGVDHYVLTGYGGLSGDNDPTIYLARGQTYEFIINSGASHPFQIRVSNGGSAYSTGVTNNGASSGVIRFEVPFSAPNALVYQCTSHSDMMGIIAIYPAT